MDKNSLVNTKATSFVFFGGPEFAARTLELLLQAGWVPQLVVTSSPTPVGRHQEFTPTRVAVLALKNNLPVLEVTNLRSDQVVNKIKAVGAEIGILTAFGMIVPNSVISIFPSGIANVHPSLLPKWRGPSPIQSSLLYGDSETGVSIMMLDSEIDHGPILTQQRIAIDKTDTYVTLWPKLASLGAQLLVESIPAYLSKDLLPQAQNHTDATFCKIIKRDDGKIDWQKKSAEINNLYRAFTPWPGIFTSWNGKRLKLAELSVTAIASTKPGLVKADDGAIMVGTTDFYIKVDSLQLEGSKILKSTDFIKGRPDFINAALL